MGESVNIIWSLAMRQRDGYLQDLLNNMADHYSTIVKICILLL